MHDLLVPLCVARKLNPNPLISRVTTAVGKPWRNLVNSPVIGRCVGTERDIPILSLCRNHCNAWDSVGVQQDMRREVPAMCKRGRLFRDHQNKSGTRQEKTITKTYTSAPSSVLVGVKTANTHLQKSNTLYFLGPSRCLNRFQLPRHHPPLACPPFSSAKVSCFVPGVGELVDQFSRRPLVFGGGVFEDGCQPFVRERCYVAYQKMW